MAGDPFRNYDSWLASSYSEGVTGQVEDDYDRYEDSFWKREREAYEAELDRLAASKFDFDVTWEQWEEGAKDELMSYDDFYEAWLERKEEEAREAYFESRYPDARM